MVQRCGSPSLRARRADLRRPRTGVAHAGVALVALAFNLAAAAGGETWHGRPRLAAADAEAAVRVLENPGFVVGYSEERRQPLWVAYRAETLKGTAVLPPRPRFEADPRTAARVGADDYRGSGYTRGHLAPNYLVGKLYGAEAQRASFLMSNIAPQSARLNALVWQRLEEAESDRVAPRAVQLWVVVGPLFGARPERLGSGIAIPEAFFRVWLDVEEGRPRALAFIVPQDVCGTEPLSRFLTSVDEVERRAGLDLFHELEDTLEAALEASATTGGWRPQAWDRRPPRYAGNFDLSRCPAH
jgi:endonuclease G, mitochondrial